MLDSVIYLFPLQSFFFLPFNFYLDNCKSEKGDHFIILLILLYMHLKLQPDRASWRLVLSVMHVTAQRRELCVYTGSFMAEQWLKV